MIRKLAAAALAVFAVLTLADPSARALAPVSSSFDAKALVVTNCTFTSATAGAMDFGNYDPLDPAAVQSNASTTMSVRCTKGTSATVTLDGGKNGNTGATRNMVTGAAGSDKLAYSITMPDSTGLTDSTTAWDTTAAYALPTSTGMGSTISFAVFGHLAPGQDVGVGSYSDTVTATVAY